MASIVNIPFNFQPVQTAVTSASYTVPAGKYAKIVAFFTTPRTVTVLTQSNQTINDTLKYITLNGNNLLKESTINVNFYNSTYGNYNTSYTGTYNLSSFSGNNNAWSSAITPYGGSPTASSNVGFSQVNYNSSGSFPFTGSIFVKLTNLSSPSVWGIGTVYTTIYDPSASDKIEFWAKSGDVISATAGNGGFTIVYTEYSNIS